VHNFSKKGIKLYAPWARRDNRQTWAHMKFRPCGPSPAHAAWQKAGAASRARQDCGPAGEPGYPRWTICSTPREQITAPASDWRPWLALTASMTLLRTSRGTTM